MARTPPSDDPLRDIFRTCSDAFVTAGVFSFAVNALILTMPMYMFSLFDRVLNSGNLTTLAMLAMIALTALFVQALIDIARTHLFVKLSAWIDAQIGEKLLILSMRNAMPRGAPRNMDLLNKLNSLRGFLAGQQIYMLMDVPWVPIFLGVLFLLNFWIGLTASLVCVVILILALFNKMIVDPRLARASKAATQAGRTAQMAICNIDVVEPMGMRRRIVGRWSVDNNIALAEQGNASRASGNIQAFVKMMRMLAMMAVMTVACMQIVDPESGLSRGAMMASVILVGRTLMPVEMMVSSWDSVSGAFVSYATIAEALKSFAKINEERVVPLDPRGEITVSNLVYQPTGFPRPILNNINFELRPGQALGIVGPSASGKSTLARMLVGLEKPSFGTVRLDGQDIHTWPTHDLGRYIGYLPQDVVLLSGSVRENISRFDDVLRKDQILSASKMAGVHSMVQQLPEGYETFIGEQGALLSGGQRQRVGLARAVYGGVKVVVLDEPNSNLDVAGEQALADAIEALKERGVTVIVILHRPNILKSVDFIMVLRDGMIQKLAPRDEMLPLIDGTSKRKAVESKVGDGSDASQVASQAQA
jgi:PrtD family type I secretion system ABC transporter